MIKPLLTVAALFVALLLLTVLAPAVVTQVMLISFSFSLLKALTVVAVARLALAYLDSRTKVDVNNWLRTKASNENKAIYFSARFAAIFIVFGFIMA